jgi:hypothetical protein
MSRVLLPWTCFPKGYRSEGRVACWHALKELPGKKFHRVVAVPPPPEGPEVDDEEEEAEPEPE